MAVRKRRGATIREVTDFVSADRLRHTYCVIQAQAVFTLPSLFERISFLSVMFLTFIVIGEYTT